MKSDLRVNKPLLKEDKASTMAVAFTAIFVVFFTNANLSFSLKKL